MEGAVYKAGLVSVSCWTWVVRNWRKKSSTKRGHVGMRTVQPPPLPPHQHQQLQQPVSHVWHILFSQLSFMSHNDEIHLLADKKNQMQKNGSPGVHCYNYFFSFTLAVDSSDICSISGSMLHVVVPPPDCTMCAYGASSVYFPDPYDCTKYYQCSRWVLGGGHYRWRTATCPDNSLVRHNTQLNMWHLPSYMCEMSVCAGSNPGLSSIR